MPARFPRALRAGRQTVCLEVHPPRSRSSPRSPRRTPTVPVLIRCYMTDTEPQRNSEWDHLVITGDTVAACPAAEKASSTAEDTGVCNASVARFAQKKPKRVHTVLRG